MIETQPRIVQQKITRTQIKIKVSIKGIHNYKFFRDLVMIRRLQLDENTMTITEDINNMDTSSNQTVIIPLSQQNQVQEDQESSQVSKYHAFSKFLIAELNKRYDLRPRPGPGRPPKEAPIIETRTKAAETQTTVIRPLNQSTDTTQNDKNALTTFNVEKELERVKIPIPLLELSKNLGYKNQVSKWIQSTSIDAESDIISLQDEKLAIIFGPSSNIIDEIVPPFYVTLKTNDSMLYNYMLDSEASHNLMPKTIMDHLKLDRTRSYHDLYTFDSKRVPCLGLIKDLVVTLAQIPVKRVVLDIVITNIPPKFGMLLFRSCCAKLGETLHMDMSYATIPVYGGEQLSLYREVIFVHTVHKKGQPRNHPIYAIYRDFGCFQLSSNQIHETHVKIRDVIESPVPNQTDVWKLFFDGSCTKYRVGAGAVLISPEKENITQSFKLEFEVTNNVAKYEAFLLGL